MYKVELSSEELELVLSTLRYTAENGYEPAHKDDWNEMEEEYNSIYRLYDKLVELR
jgi:hypothetical protein